MWDTEVSCSIIKFWTFWEFSQTQRPIAVNRSTKQTKTYSGEVVPLIDFATITFNYDPDGHFSFPLTVWIIIMKTENLQGMDFHQKHWSGIHSDLTGIELKEPPDTVCYGSFHQKKSYLSILPIRTKRTPHAMHIEAKSARCWNCSPEGSQAPFLPGSIFHRKRNAVAMGLNFVNVLCNQSESKLPIPLENNKNHQIT